MRPCRSRRDAGGAARASGPAARRQREDIVTGLHWLVVIVCAGIAYVGFHGYAESRRPIPSPLIRVSAPIEEVDVTHRRFRIWMVRLRLRGFPRPFFLDPDLTGHDAVAEAARPGRTAQIVFSQSPAGEVRLWGLSIDGETLLTPAEAHAARRRDGTWGLWLGVGMLVCLVGTVVSAHLDRRRLRRRGRLPPVSRRRA